MSPEATKKLNDRFGHILRSDKHPRYALHMYGFECQDGWYQLLWDLLEGIENYLKTVGPSEVDAFSVMQIKEKFGTLRFYCTQHFDPIAQLIRTAEDKSAVTCEICGAPGEVRFERRVQCMCWPHYVNNIVDDIEYICVGAEVSEKDNISPHSGKSYGKLKYFSDPKIRELLIHHLTRRFGPKVKVTKDVQDRR